jgi:hypothetical protein
MRTSIEENGERGTGSLLILTRLAIPAYVHELLVPHPPVHADLPAAGDPVGVNAVLHELELEWDGRFAPDLAFEPLAA